MSLPLHVSDPLAVPAEGVTALQAALHARFRGDARFDRLSRTIYSTDASIYEITPAGVLMPRDAEDVATAVRLCREHRVPIVARGAGTGIAGGAIGGGVCIDFSRYMTRIRDFDPSERTVRVQPGVVLDDLNAATARYGLSFPADVATASRATIGGMIGNNSCGSHSVYYGRTVDHVVDLTVVLASGELVTLPHHDFGDLPPLGALDPLATTDADVCDETPAEQMARVLGTPTAPCETMKPIEAVLRRLRCDLHDEILARFPRVMRRNGGYALDRLVMSRVINPATVIIGSEGTLALVVEATLRLVPNPRYKALLVLHFDSHLDAVAATPLVLRHKPAAVELVDDLILNAGVSQIAAATRDQFLSGVPRAILVAELYDDDPATLRGRLQVLDDALRSAGVGQPARLVFDPAVQQAVWTMRNKGFGLLMSKPGDRHPYEFIEDAAVDPSRLRDYIADLDTMLAEEGVHEVGHYAHASVGVIHVRPVLNLKDPADVTRLRRIAERTTELVLKYGGAMTGEHGDGIIRSEWLERMYGSRIVAAFGDIKRAFDPDCLLNPRKIVDPLPMDQRLRAAAGPPKLPERSHFDFGGHGDMAGLAGMCSGVGQCRQKLVGTMCPSYMATLDEQHTTRARAIALRAALSQHGLLKGLDDPALDEVMDLCLSCKACKTECPTGVDMARLKAEWLAHRVRARGVSRGDRFLADAARSARLGAIWPALANMVAQSSWMRAMLETRYGIDRRVAPPRFATQTFHALVASRRNVGARRPGRGRVIYFADTWMNHYWPSVGIAAVQLLESAGFVVETPRLECCGRPLISKGLLDEATTLARRNIERLSGMIDERTWIVGSEPSCILSLIDEAPSLVRGEAARRVAARVLTVEQLLARTLRDDPSAISFRAASDAVAMRVLFHGHCHQKALIGTSDANALLAAVPGVMVSEINSGCCGMAGSFGHEKKHYDVARAIGEQRLFPAVRERGDATIAVCGFSCREQLAHHTQVEAKHVLELVAAAL